MAETRKKTATRKSSTKKSATTTAKKAPKTKAKAKTRAKASTRKTTASGAKARAGKSTASKAKSKAGGASRARTRSASKAAATAKTDNGLHLDQQFGSLLDGIGDLTSNALKFASKTRERAARAREQVSGSLLKESVKTTAPEQLRRMADAGESLRDMREVAGLNLADIASALNLKDKSFLEAVEDGKEALSLEMIMRLASLYARNDPIPFVVKYIRTYRPKLWEILEDWGLDGLPLKIERERRFINIYKRRDAARQLSAEGFDKVLAFTQQSFDMALHFVAEQEDIDNDINPEFEDEEDIGPEEADFEEEDE